MYCPKCNKWNEPGYKFCIRCGTSLAGASDQVPPHLIEIQQLRQLLDQNYNSLHQLDQRLAALEKGMQMPSAAPEERVTPTPEEASLTYETLTETPKPTEATKVERSEPPPVKPEIPEVPAEEKPERPPGEWEQILGGNWLARIGVFALLIGIAFFLKYAFDKNWISPAIRVLMGGVFGLLLLGGGHLWRKKYPVMTQVLTGGGVGVMFLSVFAAFSVYNLIPFLVAVILLLVVSAVSVFFALRYNSMGLAILGVIGAFLAPLLLGISGKGGINSGVAIPIYLIIVDIGVLYISTLRNWRWFTVLSFLATVLIFQITYGRFHSSVGVAVEETFLTVLFLIFVGTTVMFNVIRRKAAKEFDFGLMVLNAAYYFGVSYYIMWGSLHEWMGLFSLIIALFYGGLFYLIRKRGKENEALSLFSLGIALIFLTIAIPVQIGNRAWTTIAWAAEGTILIWLSFRTKMPHLRLFGYLVFIPTVIRLLAYDTEAHFHSYFPVFNQRGLAFLVCIAIIYIGGYLLRRYKESLSKVEKGMYYIYPFFLGAANFLTMWFIGAELIHYNNAAITSTPSWPLLFLVVLACITTLQHVIWPRRVEIFDLVLLIVNAIFYAGVSLVVWGTFRAWMGSLYFLLSFVYFGLVYEGLKRKEETGWLASFSVAIGIIYFTLAIPIQIHNHFWVSVAWAGEFVALMWLARPVRLPQLRYFGYGVFVLTAGRLLFFDTAVKINNFQPIFNGRFLAYAAGIVAAYLGFLLLRRDRELVPERKTPALTLVIAANFLTLWLLSFEIWNYFDARVLHGMAINVARNAQNLSLTALWLVYAVILLVVGIARRSRAVRLGGLALIAVSILKVFVYDVFTLQTVYRIVAFIGLGILLLVGGFLYQRYSARIKEFLTK